MPERPMEKAKAHPFRVRETGGVERSKASAAYAELAVTSNFTFLTGASFPEEFVQQAAALGYRAMGIADANTLAGVVRAHVAAKEVGIKLAVGSRIVCGQATRRGKAVEGGNSIKVLVYPERRKGYANLCRLLTLGKRRAPKGECHLELHDLIEHQEGLVAIMMPPRVLDEDFVEVVAGLRRVFDDDRLSVAMCRRYESDDEASMEQVRALCEHVRVPGVAVNDVLYHVPERRAVQDVVTCIRHGCTIEEAGFRLGANAERFLKPPAEMERLFAHWPRALARSVAVAERAAGFSLDELRYEYPVEPCPEGMSATEYLEQETWAGAHRRYPEGVPEKTRRSLDHELKFIAELKYEPYFLTCYDIVRFARSKGILCQGRGGAANSAVCYCLGLTEVDPAKYNLLFERFISRARKEPPDIDIDFEHERREEVLQYVYEKYGRDRAAITAEVITYRGRSAVREVGKAMGLSLDCIDAMAKNLDAWGGVASEDRVREIGLDPMDATIRQVIALSRELIGFPRHLSQHVGGFVIARRALSELVPIENAAMDDRTVIEWDKDDIDAMGMLKVDCLGLGMLSCVERTFALLEGIGITGRSGERLRVADVMAQERADDPVYEMISRADTVGVFQIESRAQMSMLPRLKPREFYDLVIEVAIVRPGPIQGGMVHPYLRRRESREEIRYPKPEIEEVLKRTLGVPLFQEQAMQIAIVAAGFTPDEADGLRRAMAAWKRKGNAIYGYGKKLIEGMTERGYPTEFAERCFEQIKGFSEYGFPESHAASFAIIVYVSAWLKRFHPAAFCAGIINSQPMGFYAPAQLVRDAEEHGVEVRPVDVNRSGWDCRLEPPEMQAEGGASWLKGDRFGIRASHHFGEPDRALTESAEPAVRLGMRLVKGLKEAEAEKIAAAVDRCARFDSIEWLWRESGVSTATLRCLARADAFGSMGLDRQAALWAIRPLRDDPMPLFEQHDAVEQASVLPVVAPDRRVLHDYQATGLSLKAHPMSFLRASLAARGVIETAELRDEKRSRQGRQVAVAGVVLCRQRPGTASGVVFITLEDETGIANLIVWPKVFEKFRRVGRLSTVLLARGRVERAGEVVHVHVSRLESLDKEAPELLMKSRNFH